MNNLTALLQGIHEDAFVWAMQCVDFQREDALDALQESYLKVLEGRAIYNEQAAFKTWLFSVIRNTSIDLKRRKGRYRNFLAVFASKSSKRVEIGEMEAVPSKQLESQLIQLSPKQREVITLVFYHQMTIESAAEVMDISLGTARTHYERAKSRLKFLLKKEQLTYRVTKDN